MKTSPSIILSREESVMWDERDEAFLPKWRAEIDRLHKEWPGHDIHTICVDENGAPEVRFIWKEGE